MKRLVFLWLVSLLGSIGAYSQEDASYPWQVKGDSLLLFEGTTYRYTVDTPEDSGLVSTLIKVEDLRRGIIYLQPLTASVLPLKFIKELCLLGCV